MRVAVTGASGFVGSALVSAFAERAVETRALFRADLDAGLSLAGTDVIVHAAGLAHSTGGAAPSDGDYHAVNVELTRRLAEIAIRDGVRRFIFVSTVHVVAGNVGVLSPASAIAPINAYSASKARAEAYLLGLSGIEIVILRPPLVYGLGAKGNLAALLRLAESGTPLPFAGLKHTRSMVGIGNLVDALAFLAQADSTRVAGRIFHVTDGVALSLPTIVSAMRTARGSNPRLFWLPVWALKLVLQILGRGGQAAQLLEGLDVDGSDLEREGWRPPFPASHDLARMARAVIEPNRP